MNLITGNAVTGFVTAVVTGPEEILFAFVMLLVEVTAIVIFIAATANLTGEIKKSLASLALVAGLFSISSLMHFVREFLYMPSLEIWENIFVILSIITFILAVEYLRRIVSFHHFGEAGK